jgi:anti-sigma B factor antagonist
VALLISLGESSPGEVLETEIRQVGTHALVILAGEIDVSTVGQLYPILAELARGGVCHVSLNVAEVTFIDSTGLSLLISEHKRAESMNGELIIFSPSDQMRRLFEITALDGVLNVRPISTAPAHSHHATSDASSDASITSLDGWRPPPTEQTIETG